MTRPPALLWNARGSRSWILLPRDDDHGDESLPPPSPAGAGAVPEVPCAYPPLLLAVHHPDSTPPGPTPTDFSAPQIHKLLILLQGTWDGSLSVRTSAPEACDLRQGAFEEGNAGEALMMLQKWFSVWCSLDHFGPRLRSAGCQGLSSGGVRPVDIRPLCRALQAWHGTWYFAISLYNFAAIVYYNFAISHLKIP